MKAILVATLFATLTVAASAFTRVQCPKENGEDVTLLPNPQSCTTYYVCDSGRAVLMKCNDGLHFNAELRVCDWPDHAGCQSSAELPNDDGNDNNDDNNGGDSDNNGDDGENNGGDGENNGGDGDNNDNGNGNDDIEYEDRVPSEPGESILETHRQWN